MKNIIVTGGSGFLGKQFINDLTDIFEILNLDINPQADIVSKIDSEIPKINQGQIFGMIHCAGKAHIYPKTAEEKQAFFDVNYVGTKNILESIKNKNCKKFIFISSVSVYGLSNGESIDENTPLNGNTPYALSKIQAEKEVISYCNQNNIDYLILRLPLLVGQNPPGNLGKMIQGIKTGKYARIAKGEAQKSMVVVKDVVQLVKSWLLLEKSPSGIYHLTDRVHPTFYELEEHISKQFNKNIKTIPFWLAKLMGKIGDTFSFFPINSSTIEKITCSFTFSDEKAVKELGWKPSSTLNFKF